MADSYENQVSVEFEPLDWGYVVESQALYWGKVIGCKMTDIKNRQLQMLRCTRYHDSFRNSFTFTYVDVI